MFEKLIAKLDYLKPWKVIPALIEAVKKAKNEKDKGFFEKIGIFWESFKAEVHGINKEKKKVTKKTGEKVQKDVAETLKGVNEKLGLKSVDSNKPADKAEKETYDTVLAAAVNSLESLDEEYKKHGSNGLEKITNASDGTKEEQMTVAEAASVGAWVFGTLQILKEKSGNDPAKLKKMLDDFAKVSRNSKYPLNKLLKISVLKVFKVSDPLNAANFLKKMNIGLFGMPNALNIVSLLKKHSLNDEDKTEIAKFMKNYILKNTSEANIKNAIGIINTMIVNKVDHVSTKNLADLACLIDDADYEELITLLAGKRSEVLAKAA